MSPIGPEHNAAVARANRALVNAVGEKAIVIKTELYAEAGISEYWIADIQNDCVLVYSRPDGKAYKATRRINRGEQLTPQLLPDCGIKVDDLLP